MQPNHVLWDMIRSSNWSNNGRPLPPLPPVLHQILHVGAHCSMRLWYHSNFNTSVSVRTVSGEAVPHGGSHATIPWIKFWYKGVGRRQKPLEFTSMRDYPYWRNFNFPLPSLPLLRFSPFFVIIPLPPIFGHLSLPAKCGEEQGDVESLKEARGRENPAVGIWQSISSLFFLQTLT